MHFKDIELKYISKLEQCIFPKHLLIMDAVILSLLTPQMIGFTSCMVYAEVNTPSNVQITGVQILWVITFLSAAYIDSCYTSHSHIVSIVT